MTSALRPIRVEGDVAFISLTQGKTAIIDAADIPLVGGVNWLAILRAGHKWYAVRGYPKLIGLHQFLMPVPPGLLPDHKDGDGLNNRRSNLRVATWSQNSQNRRLPSNNTSGFKGVCHEPDRNTWVAQIGLRSEVGKRRRVKIGRFKSAEEAALAYDKAAIEHFGEFAVLNFPNFTDFPAPKGEAAE